MGRNDEGLTVGEKYGGPIKQLRYWHKGIARAAIAGNRRPSELARIFGYTEAHMTRILESPLVQAEMNRLESGAEIITVDMATELKLRQGPALQVLDEVLGDIDEDGEMKAPLSMRKDVALEILDRTGYGKTAKNLHLHLHEEKGMEEGELDRRIEALLEKKAEGEGKDLTEQDIIDVTPNEVESASA